ncbi:MAG: helix-turn-helix domain-containing protein [Porticoccaceae bacterium]|nr:helix-turn-helix domain-containing protein [Pseudomonadales bacterium]MCP5173074.1 helix-turn-helix domain-containing protein [Pseudomonadales bacterium]MCP5302548.1 helix-turn-helix domain-containing protein [Pseudomonadales bacterium]
MVTKAPTPPKPLKVATLLYDNLLATSATLPIEMLRMAEAANQATTTQHQAIETINVSISMEPVTSPSGFNLVPTCTLDQTDVCSIINLPALWRNPRPALRRYQAYLPWLRDQAAQGAIITAVGTGACFLAEAGLLNNQPATTHWHYFDRFQKDYPQVALKRNYFITRSNNIYCAASVNAVAQLMVHLIFRQHGRAVASQVERNFFHEVRNAFNPVGYFDDQVDYHPDENIVQAQIWLEDNFSQSIKIAEVAAQFGFSLRNFDRRFKQALAVTPLQYLQRIRLKNASELLKQSNLSIAEIAAHCGYADASAFSRQFSKQLHTSPRKYRETVRAKLFSHQNRT